MELFELIGKITIQGVENAEKSIKKTIDYADMGAEKISHALNRINNVTTRFFDHRKISSYNFENMQSELTNEQKVIKYRYEKDGKSDDPSDNYKTVKYSFEKIDAQYDIFDENVITASAEKAGRLITGFYSEIEKNILTRFSQLSEKLNYFNFPVNTDWLLEVNKALKQIINLFSGEKNIFKGLFNFGKQNNFKDFFNLQINNISDEITAMKSTVSEKMPEISMTHCEELEKIYSNSLEKWRKIGNTAAIGISGMSRTILNGKSAVISACSSVAGDALKSLMVDASSAGEYIVNSLDSGIYNSAYKIYSTASAVANTISQTLSNITANINVTTSSARTQLPAHAKGGIVTREHIARVGEDGAEAIIPLEKNTQWIDKVAERLNGSSASNNAILEKLSELNDNIKNLKIYLDSGALVGEIAPKMDKKLGSIARQKRRGTVI